jgi:hypothetical protein
MSDLYNEWLEASAALKKAKALELQLRNAICGIYLSEKLEGAVTAKDSGFTVTATAKLNRSVDREILEAIWDDLTPEEQECVDYKPSLKLTNYKKIEATGGKLLEAITVKPGQATLKIVQEDV